MIRTPSFLAWSDKEDRFGVIRRIGLQHRPEAKEWELLSESRSYDFCGGVIYNLLADVHIGNYFGVANAALAYAVASAIAATGTFASQYAAD